MDDEQIIIEHPLEIDWNQFMKDTDSDLPKLNFVEGEKILPITLKAKESTKFTVVKKIVGSIATQSFTITKSF